MVVLCLQMTSKKTIGEEAKCCGLSEWECSGVGRRLRLSEVWLRWKDKETLKFW